MFFDDNKKVILDTIERFLEKAPTLYGLPLEFIPNDLIVIQEGESIFLDFSSSSKKETYIEKIVSCLDFNQAEKDFKEGLPIDFTIYYKIVFIYHKEIYHVIHMDAKEQASIFLKNTIAKSIGKLTKEHQKKFLYQNRMLDNFYTRGLKDFDYDSLNVSLASKEFKNDLNRAVLLDVKNYMDDNGLNIPVDEQPLYLTDLNNINEDLAVRIQKILLKNKDFYYMPLLKNKIIHYRSLKNMIVPVYKIEHPYIKDKILYFTPFSCYLSYEIGTTTKYLRIYHISRDTLISCEERLIKVLKNVQMSMEYLTFVQNMRLK